MYIPETKWEENNIITEQEILEAKNLFDQGYSRGLQEGYQQNQAFPKDKNELAGFLKGRLRQ
ncbi:hypothetical protein A2515_04905 [Candidatus Falkowbacteria bacterium RIFOXYD12_FULL_34_57]|nr:MAG: hypothetical protein A2466_01320 [Candidatus Falkowbacteria bacterium RIFOXYC2_FULL_34_220]OGF38656.1 MAG: hypothetical protein A2515_04905 [Candidatus Falkowbacteria bacterium RIFOXYD12_FULL_34_57]